MQKVVGVKFDNNNKVYYFNPKQLRLKLDDKVIVLTENGLEMGTIALGLTEINDNELVEPLKDVVRIANKKDFETKKKLKQKEKDTLISAKKIIEKHKLEMDLINVEYSFDSSKIIFTYTAEGRVDFRELIKDFASTFKAKIELRQVGVRDEVKMVGGLGPCGREVCCKKFLNDFGKVSIKMAKNQNLSLNPTNISGLCGRLMCCLEYENDFYADALKEMPKINQVVKTPDGEGTVVYNDLFKKTCTVKIVTENETINNEYEVGKLIFKKGNKNEQN